MERDRERERERERESEVISAYSVLDISPYVLARSTGRTRYQLKSALTEDETYNTHVTLTRHNTTLM